MIDKKTKEILDDQRLIFGATLKEYFDVEFENKDEGNNMISDIMNNLRYPTLNGEKVTAKEIKMNPLDNQQQEYIILKTSNDRMMAHYRELKRTGQIPQCRKSIEFPYPPQTTIEAIFLDYMDILKKEVS